MESVFTVLRGGQSEPGGATIPGKGGDNAATGAAVFSVPLPPAGADGAARPFRALPEGGNALPPLSISPPPAAQAGADAAVMLLSGSGQSPAASMPDLVLENAAVPATSFPDGSLPASVERGAGGLPADPPLQPVRPLDGDSVTLLVAGEVSGAGLEIATSLDNVPVVDPARPADEADAAVPAIVTGAGAVTQAADAALIAANREAATTVPAGQLAGSPAGLRLADLPDGPPQARAAFPADASARGAGESPGGQPGNPGPPAPSATAASPTPGAGAQATVLIPEAPPAAEMVNTLRQVLADLTRERGAADGRRSAEPVLRTEGGALAAGLSPPAAAGPSPSDRPAFLLPTPPGSPQFAEQLGERIVWMAGQKLDRAQIRLNPAHLGPISVDLTVGDDGASVTFTAHHAATRDALEQALPRLRELFGESGLQLAGADVSGQRDRGGDGWPGGAPDDARPVLIAGEPLESAAEESGRAASRLWEGGRGLIDTYV